MKGVRDSIGDINFKDKSPRNPFNKRGLMNSPERRSEN